MSQIQEQIKKIAEKLSKVPGGNQKLAGNIEDIISYMNLLDEVDTTWVEPTISVVTQGTPLREDKIEAKIVNPKDLLDCSNQKVVSDQIVLPNIMK